jgi:hypothetical protein
VRNAVVEWLKILWAFLRVWFHTKYRCWGEPVTFVDENPMRLTIQCNCGCVFYDTEFDDG